MPGMLYKPCKRCHQYWKVDMISRRGLCPKCAQAAMDEFKAAMREKSGPRWEAWVESWKAAMRRLLDGKEGGDTGA